ncbi:MAG: ABC transporter substrate-binding protein [Thermotogaceae bacterium]|jgi:hypothetical protein|nr:ABC transporter substrate-binding protein [Thermotogaceae bacterium]
MGSIVLELQNEVTKQDCDIVNVLRKAHLIARKLNLIDFDKWISCELNGYTDDDTIPEYREVQGVLKALNPYHGWVCVMVTNKKTEEALCCRRLRNSISEIKSLSDKNENFLVLNLPSAAQILLNEWSGSLPTQFRVELSATAIGDILEKVKNTVLEWTMKLEEEGILGEGMQFNSTEKEIARRIPQTVNNYYGSNINVINAPMNDSPVIAGNNNSMEFSFERAGQIATEIERSLNEEKISTEDHESAIEMLAEIKEKISQQKRTNVIKAALVGLKDFLIGAGASATVALIQAKMQGLF